VFKGVSMKIKLGGDLGLTISNIPYSPIKVETTLIVEKEIDENIKEEELDTFIKELSDKVEAIMLEDLESKMSKMAKKQRELIKKLEKMQ